VAKQLISRLFTHR